MLDPLLVIDSKAVFKSLDALCAVSDKNEYFCKFKLQI